MLVYVLLMLWFLSKLMYCVTSLDKFVILSQVIGFNSSLTTY